MKKGFTRLLATPQPSIHGGEVDEDEDAKEEEDGKVREMDGLKEEIRLRDKKARHYVLTAAKLIAPYIDRNEWVAGFDWLIGKKSYYPPCSEHVVNMTFLFKVFINYIY